MERQLSLEDALRMKRSVRQMQEDALRLARRYMEQERFKPYRDVTYQSEIITYALQSLDDLAGLVLKTVTFIENFQPMIFDLVIDPLQGQAISELSAAHLAYHGKMDLANDHARVWRVYRQRRTGTGGVTLRHVEDTTPWHSFLG
jgi:hypothetical protein